MCHLVAVSCLIELRIRRKITYPLWARKWCLPLPDPVSPVSGMIYFPFYFMESIACVPWNLAEEGVWTIPGSFLPNLPEGRLTFGDLKSKTNLNLIKSPGLTTSVQQYLRQENISKDNRATHAYCGMCSTQDK